MGNQGDVSYLLKTHKPRILVDEDGGEVPPSLTVRGSLLIFLVGWIVCGEDALSPQAAAMVSPPNESRDVGGTPLFVTCLSSKHGER